jgi:hypothetical protein
MKILIKENKLKDLSKKYIWKELSDLEHYNMDSFILVHDGVDDEDSDVVLEYDFYDGRLYINGDWMKLISNLLPIDKKTIESLVDEWFENKFDVSVNPEAR